MVPARPQISDPSVARRLALDPAAFHDYVLEQAARLEKQSIRDARLHRAYSYPYERLGFSFLATPERVFPLVEAPSGSALDARVVDGSDVVAAREVPEVADAAGDRAAELQRFPLLSYGANVSIEGIGGKIGHLTGHDSILPVISGDLLDFDVTYSPHLTLYGSLPSTLHPCEGVRSPVAVLLATAAQVTAIARLELNYRFGWLEGAAFTSSSGEITGDLYAFVSRHGSFAPEGQPLALSAVETESRTFPAGLEEDALGVAAGIVGVDSAEELVYRTVDDYHWAVRQRPALAEHSLPFETGAWVEFAG
jgi:hypothetical protein